MTSNTWNSWIQQPIPSKTKPKWLDIILCACFFLVTSSFSLSFWHTFSGPVASNWRWRRQRQSFFSKQLNSIEIDCILLLVCVCVCEFFIHLLRILFHLVLTSISSHLNSSVVVAGVFYCFEKEEAAKKRTTQSHTHIWLWAYICMKHNSQWNLKE